MQEIKSHKLLGRELLVLKKKKLLAGIIPGLFGCDCSFLPSGVPLELILMKLEPTPKERLYCGFLTVQVFLFVSFLLLLFSD